MAVIGVTKTRWERTPDQSNRQMRIVNIGGVRYRQYRSDELGYCLELIERPEVRSGWRIYEYQTIAWAKARHEVRDSPNG